MAQGIKKKIFILKSTLFSSDTTNSFKFGLMKYKGLKAKKVDFSIRFTDVSIVIKILG